MCGLHRTPDGPRLVQYSYRHQGTSDDQRAQARVGLVACSSPYHDRLGPTTLQPRCKRAGTGHVDQVRMNVVGERVCGCVGQACKTSKRLLLPKTSLVVTVSSLVRYQLGCATWCWTRVLLAQEYRTGSSSPSAPCMLR